MMTTSVVSAITSVWDAIMSWITGSLESVQTVFFDSETGLTFLGTLAIISVAIGVVFLVIGVIQNFLKLRG